MILPQTGLPLLASGAVAGVCVAFASAWSRLRQERDGLRARLRQTAIERDHLHDEIVGLREAAEGRQRAEAASESKSRFLATVSHEVRTPLHGIIGVADLLAGSTLSREQQSYVTMIRSSSTALASLVNEILDFSRIESGRLDLVAEPFDLAGLVESVVELVAPKAQEKGLEVASLVSSAIPRRAVGDALRLRQVLTNLLDNAVKFTAHGGVGVRVVREDHAVRFSVLDTGPGVPENRRTAIFEAFEQVDGTTTRLHGGSGLGLSIARRRAAGIGDDLTVEDRPDGGSVFSFAVQLPAAPASHPAATEAPSRPQRVLIAAAGVFQADFITTQLAERGVRITRARTAEEAAVALRSGRPDLLFVDCALGEEAVRRLSDEARAAGVERTVLLFTPGERRRFGQALMDGFDSWLVKPVRAHSLAARLADPVPASGTIRFAPSQLREATGTRVLVADDNPISALVARAALERCGAAVTQAADGAAAFARFESLLTPQGRPFDLILMDVSMPEVDGLEATRRIRAAERRLGARPARIVAMTAHAFEATVSECRQAGMNAVLTKPISPDQLRGLLADRDEVRRAV